MSRNDRKVFCLGFHKTGTTSLKQALNILGFKVMPVKTLKKLDASKESWEIVKGVIDDYDAFKGLPFPQFFRELYEYRPDSKFILTMRPTQDWIRSATNFFGDAETPKRKAIYGAGSPVGNEAAYTKTYDDHNKAVLEFFADKPGRLLVMDLATGIGWPELCAFLEVPIPSAPFPHRNPTTEESIKAAREKLSVAIDD